MRPDSASHCFQPSVKTPGATGTRGGRTVRLCGVWVHLKSLSLEVIFSSRLEMWYEALAMSVSAVSLLLAERSVSVFRLRCLWLLASAACCSGFLGLGCASGPGSGSAGSGSGSDAAAFSSPTATVASRAAEFDAFEWNSRSVCRGAGLAELDCAGSKVTVWDGWFILNTFYCNSDKILCSNINTM